MPAPGVDWRMHLYGGAVHSFTSPGADGSNRRSGTTGVRTCCRGAPWSTSSPRSSSDRDGFWPGAGDDHRTVCIIKLMVLKYSADVEAFRQEVRQVPAVELPADFAGVGSITDRAEATAFVARWRAALYRHGLLAIAWPVEFGGRGSSRLRQVALVEELARDGVPYGAPCDTYALKMAGQHARSFRQRSAETSPPAGHPVRHSDPRSIA
jgi:hypothetical protein